MEKSYIFLADGFEEIEALTVVDILRRADMEAVTVSINAGTAVTGAHGIRVTADMVIADLPADVEAEWLVCPGGMPGASNLAACEPLTALLRRQFVRRGRIAAICAAPAVVLAPLGILAGREATCYPGFEQLAPDATLEAGPVVALPSLVTGNGPAAAMPFALAIVAGSLGAEAAAAIAQGLLYRS